MTTPIFDLEKTIQSALYVAERIKIKDFHKIFKILYFADRGHLSKYGSPITGDTYIKMPKGPVPTKLFDIFKSIRNYKHFQGKNMEEYFAVHDNYFVIPKKEADLRYLSKTDMEELDKAISEYGTMPFGLLTTMSHDIAWEYAKNNKAMSIENILRETEDDEEYIAYITENINCQKAFIQ